MKQWRCAVVMAMLMCGCAVNAVAQEASASGDVQLQRLLIDYHAAQFVRLGIQQGMAQLKPSPAQSAALQRMSQRFATTSDSAFAETIAPAVRDCISEDRARVVADFLETDSGRTLIGWMLQRIQYPGQAIPPPHVDPNLIQSFATSGGLASLQQFSACLNDSAHQQQMASVVLHYATSQPGGAN
jgi:hypothetical protein